MSNLSFLNLYLPSSHFPSIFIIILFYAVLAEISGQYLRSLAANFFLVISNLRFHGIEKGSMLLFVIFEHVVFPL